MEYLLPCDCGKVTPVTKTQAGQQVDCVCGKTLEIPPLRGFSRLQPVEDKKPEVVERNAWAGLRGVVFAICFAAAGYAAYRASFHAYYGTFMDTNVSVEEYLEETNRDWRTYGPAEIATIFEDMGDYALNTKTPPNFFRFQKIVEDQRRLAMITGGIAALLLLVCLGIWWTTPKTVRLTAKSTTG